MSPGVSVRRSAWRRRHEGLAEELLPVEHEEVEHQVRDGRPALAAQARGQAGRVGPAGAVDDDQLAVDDRRAGEDARRQVGQLGQERREVAAVAVDQPERGAVGRLDEGEGPLAAPRRFEEMARRVEGLRRRLGEHRPEVGRQARQTRLEPQRQLIGHRRPMVATTLRRV